jgi:hypothetical protein
MLMMKERRPAIRTLQGWAISVLLDAGAICECEEHGWMKDRADPHARERALCVSPLMRLPAPVVSKAGLMPTYERLGPDDREDFQDRWKPAIQLHQEPTIMVGEPDATMQPTPQDHQLMSKHRVLSLKPQLRLEWHSQNGQQEIEQPDHSASLGDSITSSTRIRFLVHTGFTRRR